MTVNNVKFAFLLFQMSNIKRLGPRLTSILFKLKFPELVSEIKPVSRYIKANVFVFIYSAVYIMCKAPVRKYLVFALYK